MRIKRFMSILMALCMVMTMLPVSTLATEDAPELVDGYYEIYTADQLYWFAAEVNGGNTSINGKLMADIVVNENVLNADGTLNGDGSNFRVWIPVGYYNSNYDNAEYTGNFDGNGKTVSGLYFNDTAKSYVGLFGYLGSDGKVQNVGVVDSCFGGDMCVGGVVGYNYYGIVSNCYNTGTVSGDSFVGGVVGRNGYDGIVSNSYNTGFVSGSEDVGGVVGDNWYGTVSNSYNTGTVSGSEDVGGVVGYNVGLAVNNTGFVSNSYNTGTVSGSEDVGGVVGYNRGNVSNSYNTGNVSGSSSVGGVVGYNSKTVSNSYNIGSVSGSIYVGGVVGQNISTSGMVANCYYPTGCAIDGSNKIQFGIGCETQGGVTEDTEGATTAKTVEQFASGEVCVLLQGEQTEQIWGQEIGVDPSPVFSDDVVYETNDGYTNTPPGVTVSGQLTSYLEGDVTVELVQDGEVVYSTTANGGSYVFEGVVAGDYTLRVTKVNHISQEYAVTVGNEAVTQDATICPTGDVTGDGAVNIKDFQRLLRHVNKTNPLEGYALACGDVTGDGVVNIKDFQRLLRHVNKTNPLF